jgi:hypothetical protein
VVSYRPWSDATLQAPQTASSADSTSRQHEQYEATRASADAAAPGGTSAGENVETAAYDDHERGDDG